MKFLKHNVTLAGALEGLSGKSVYLRHVRDNLQVYVFGIISVFLTNITEISIPKVIQWMIEVFTSTGSNDVKLRNFHNLFFLFVGILLVQVIGRIAWRLTLAQQTHYTAAQMKSLLWDRARFLPRQRLETDMSPGELMNVATGDVGMARFIFGFTLVGTVDFIFLLIFGSTFMFLIDWELTLYALFVLPILPLFLDKLARKENDQHKDAQNSLSALTDLASQAVSTIRLQKITQTEGFWNKKLLDSAKVYQTKRFQVVKTGYLFIPATGIAPLISYVFLLILGFKKLYAGDLSIGGFVAMQGYIFLIQGPMIELGVIISEWQRAGASFGRLLKVLRQSEAEQLRSGGEKIVSPTQPTPIFEVKDLRFAYPKSERVVLDRINLSLKKSERLGIRGPIGTGKTTLVQILSGFERNFSGSVELLGQDIRSYAHKDLRKHIGIVPQKPFLFADTVRNNVNLMSHLTDDEIWNLLDLTCLKEDFQKFPDGLNSRLGEWGINLSGGQKQRLTLTRTLAAKPEIIFLDDCLSAVDTVTEEKILNALDESLKNQTLIWVAHRSSTLKYCDRILELGEAAV